MFARVAACGIAAFVLVMPVASSGETGIVPDAISPAALIASAHEQSQALDQDHDWAADLLEQAHQDAQARTELASLDPLQPSIKPPIAAPAIAVPAVPGPFGSNTAPIADGGVVIKWTGVEADIRADEKILARCRTNAAVCPTAAKSFLAVIAEGQAKTGRARIGTINRAINMAIQPMSDLEQWGVIDRWSSPLETFTTGRGDCEDYAIAKYVALTEAGVAADDVKLVIVHDTVVGEDHAVVATRLDGAWIVLDNRWLQMVADAELPRTIPLFVLDRNGVRAFAPNPAPIASRAAPAAIGN